ncbi:hypothetical protein MPER_11283, partial [Moniliophthora perniciosa FA553]
NLFFVIKHIFLKSSTSSDEDTAALQTRVADLEAEVNLLREQLGRAKGVNDLMWENVVQKMISQSKSKSANGSEEDERARKKSRS